MTHLTFTGFFNDMAARQPEAMNAMVGYYRKEGWVFGLMKCCQCSEISYTLEPACRIPDPTRPGEFTSYGPFQPCPHCGSVCGWKNIFHLHKQP